MQGVKEPTSKRVKKGEETKRLDVSAVQKLDGEDTGTVEVFDTCDEVRRKINAKLRDPNITKAGFTRELKKGLPEGTSLQTRQVDEFLKKKGPMSGNTSAAYYAAYVFFEKLRIQQRKDKSQHRLQCEREWPDGVDTSRPLGIQRYICHKDERPVMNSFGQVSFF